MPTTGRWEWKEDTHQLFFISNNPGADRTGGKKDKRQNKPGVHFPDHGAKRDRATPSMGSRAYGVARGGRHSRGPVGQRGQSGKQTENKHVRLLDVKSVAYDMMSEVEEIAQTFESLFGTEQFDKFLLCLLNYFHYFFEKKAHEEKPNPMNMDLDGNPVYIIETRATGQRVKDPYNEPSVKEKRYYAELCANVEGAQKILGSSYCILVLGIGLEGQHHMACGGSRVSATYQDRSMYESLYTYCTFVVWIAHKRKDFETVKKEISRMLRSDTFNPAIRVKNAPDPGTSYTRLSKIRKTKYSKKSDEENGDNKNKKEKKLTPAEMRRLQGKRPPIKSIINQRSPALVSILPSPAEEANWLFKRTGALSPTSLGEIGKEGDEEEEEIADQLKSLHLASSNKLKTGIIGEPMSQFNPLTLMPVGQETEEGEEEGEEGPAADKSARRESTMAQSHKTPPSQQKDGVSREVTAMSATTVEALPDDD